jgi:hypothetical protein
VQKPIAFSGSAVLQCGAFAVALVLLVSRRPDAVLNAQFWAEDGKFWYADAYTFGLRSLLMPEAGYLHTTPRIVALLTLLFPFALAPLVMNLFALIVQILPVSLFLSRRFASLSLKIRLLASFLYLALPNSYEIHATTTNIQWHLALIGCMLLVSDPPVEQSLARQVISAAVLVLISLDSPLGILLIPIAASIWWSRRDKPSQLSVLALMPGSLLQILLVTLTHSRRPASNGATVSGFTSIVGIQVFLSSLLGTKTCFDLMALDDRFLFLLETVATVLGIAIFLYALRHAPLQLKSFIAFAVLVIAVSLWRPIASTDGVRPQWEVLQTPGLGSRYYFFPMMAFLACLLWLAVTSKRTLRYSCIALLLLTPVGIARDWAYRPFADLSFAKYAERFRTAAPGSALTIPINPDWKMQLVKR